MSVKNELDKFGKFVIQQSRTRLTKEKKNTSKKLYDSLDYDLKVTPRSFSLTFVMEKYGQFVDKGVHGIGGSRANKANGEIGKPYKKKEVDSNSPFKFKKGIENKPSRKHFDAWVVKKGIAPRSGGKFISRIGLTTAISHIVWHEGLKTTNFFTKPFEQAFKKLPDELIEAYALEVEDLLKFSTK